MRYQYAISIAKGYPLAFILVAVLVTGFEIRLVDLAQIFAFSLIYALPTAISSILIGYYLFAFLLKQFKANYFVNVVLAGLLTSVFVGILMGFIIVLVLRGNIFGGETSLALFFIVPTLIAGFTSSLFFWYSTK